MLLEAIPNVVDVQCAWLLLVHCASARANYSLRVVRPEWVHQFAVDHDRNLWKCLCAILRVSVDGCGEPARSTATLPLSLGGLGLRSAQRSSVAAYWASWADALPMIQERHPAVADQIVHRLEGFPDSPCLVPQAELLAVWTVCAVGRCLHGQIWQQG